MIHTSKSTSSALVCASPEKKKEMFPAAPWPKRVKTEVAPVPQKEEEEEAPAEQYWPTELLAKILSERNNLDLFRENRLLLKDDSSEGRRAIFAQANEHLESFFGKAEFGVVVRKAKEIYPEKWEYSLTRISQVIKAMAVSPNAIVYCVKDEDYVFIPEHANGIFTTFDALCWRDYIRLLLCDERSYKMTVTAVNLDLFSPALNPAYAFARRILPYSNRFLGYTFEDSATFGLFNKIASDDWLSADDRSEAIGDALLKSKDYGFEDTFDDELDTILINDFDEIYWEAFDKLMRFGLFPVMKECWDQTRRLLEKNDDTNTYQFRPSWFGNPKTSQRFPLIRSRALTKFLVAWDKFLCVGEIHNELCQIATNSMDIHLDKAAVDSEDGELRAGTIESGTINVDALAVESLSIWHWKIETTVTNYIIGQHDKELETFIDNFATFKVKFRSVDLDGNLVPL